LLLQTFETFEPPKAWVDILNNMDAVICPSQFNYKIFAHAGVKRPLYYVPHCIDVNVYNKNIPKLHAYDKFHFSFRWYMEEKEKVGRFL
jgi:glycosyltransferase involved in cell wall biosynthesis